MKDATLEFDDLVIRRSPLSDVIVDGVFVRLCDAYDAGASVIVRSSRLSAEVMEEWLRAQWSALGARLPGRSWCATYEGPETHRGETAE